MAIHDVVEAAEVAEDYLSDVVIMGSLRQLIVTAWNGTLSIYDYDQQDRKVELNTVLRHAFPLLSCCAVFPNDAYKPEIYCGDVQGQVFLVDLELGKFIPVGGNAAQLGVSSLCSYQNQVICGSWDGLLQVIDCQSQNVVYQQRLNDKILSIDAQKDRLVVATTNNTVLWWSLPLQTNDFGAEVESGLKFQTRRIKLTPRGDGYVSSSLDGRVAVEFFQDDTKKFAFRCHRMNLADTSFVFPVNALAFVPNSTILYTGGSDGCVSCWNLATRKKVDQLTKFNENSVVQLDCDGRVLCVATSDDSFKTNAVVNQDTELQSSRLYLVFLN
ncbi:hypothetical protein ZYGR_0AF01520 [Zygosaccharomyces rouxii]|uniref:Uncharacterized protein n=1 Tax=Zygosaccharomyces rouxii TaxID=4956 RepID=A0A1Q3A7N0_ZYGRO|nr:hypothetical protein ZYGR_0AF01520 [Zygosaccharomyces rouxii]